MNGGKWAVGIEVVRFVGPAIALFGLLWVLAKPHAENFVNTAVDGRFNKVEEHLRVIKRRQTIQEQGLIRLDEKLNYMNSVQQEMSNDIKSLLKSK